MLDLAKSPFTFFPFASQQQTDDTLHKVGTLYSDTLQKAWQEWFSSSALIVQQHATRVWVETSQECFKALAENTARLQQKTWLQLLGTHQQAAAVVVGDSVQAATDAVNNAIHA